MFELIQTKTYRILFVLAVIVTLILTLSVVSGFVHPGMFSDKLAHAIIFFILAFLLSHWLGKQYGILAITALILFGLLIEVIQYYLPWRSFSYRDWAADIIGVIFYQILHLIFALYQRIRHVQ